MIRKLLCCAVCLAALGREPVHTSFQQDAYEDVTDDEADFSDWFLGLFSERKIVHIAESRGGAELLSVDGHGGDAEFCLRDENDKRLRENVSVVSCGCCLDHLIGDPRSQAALLYMGRKDWAPAFDRDSKGTTHQVGMVPVWTLGGRIPAVLCDRGRMVCHCEDPLWEWAEFEHSCRRGQTCRPMERAVEEASFGYHEVEDEDEDSEGSANSSDDGQDGPDASRKRPKADDKNGSKSTSAASLLQESETIEKEIPDCAPQIKSDSADARYPLGSAFCEDFSLARCDETYVRTDLGVHHWCEIDEKMFRHCGANLVSEQEAQRVTDEAQSWAIQNFYRPDLGWKVETIDFTTRVVEHPLPEPLVFEQHVEKRMEAQGTAEILKKM